MTKEKKYICIKCKKKKNKSEGSFYLKGTQFCCKLCKAKEKKKKQKKNICEFC